MFADVALARRIELFEARNVVEFAEAYAKTSPASETDAATISVGGGQAAFAGVGSPLTHAIGLGMDGPVSATDLDRLEHFYHNRGAAITVDLCPLADVSLNESLAERGYRIAEFNNVLARTVAPGEDRSITGSTPHVRRANSGEAELWGRTVLRGLLRAG